MTHSLKNIWITIFSILAMLIASYVSSAPMMAMNSMLVSMPEVTSSHNNHSPSGHIEYSELSAQHHQQPINCHSEEGSPGSEHQTKIVMSHCGDAKSSVDTCCASVCSSISYPTEVACSPNPLSSTLALHHSIQIGVKVSRIQSLLRPPSA
ncbi:MAG: hypothetical protein VX212_13480 [Pseudomonadota bacterium]|nr:hypothetical protein [Pseudomonadota bacterium]